MPSKFNQAPNYQDLFKFIAIISMIIDHYGIFIHNVSWLRLVGRIAMPFFCFFAGYNYYRIKSEQKIIFCFQILKYKKLTLIGIILQFLHIIFIPELSFLNIILSIIISLSFIDLSEKYRISSWFFNVLLIVLIPFSYEVYDYGTIGTGFVYLGYVARLQRNIMYRNLVAMWSVVLLMFSSGQFSNLEIIILFIISIGFFYIFSFVNFEQRLQFKPLLISRYVLEIFCVQYILFILIHGIKLHSI